MRENAVEGCMACEQEQQQQTQKVLKAPEQQEAKKEKAAVDFNMTTSQSSFASKVRRGVKGTGRHHRKERRRNKGGIQWVNGEARVININRKWSGTTFFQDVERKMFRDDYDAKVSKAIHSRNLYKSSQHKIKIQFKLLKSTNAGPEWFQDLSSKQMAVVDNLEGIIIADLEEGIVSRTQRNLTELGVYPALPAKKVWFAIKMSHNDPIRFLFLVHKAVVEEEQDEYKQAFLQAKKDGSSIAQFSINERLLLSSVFHHHFKEFCYKLDKILPEPYKAPIMMLAKKYQPPPKEKYDSPYMEPQPLPRRVWYEQRAEDELYAKEERRKAALKAIQLRQQVADAIKKFRREKEEKIRQLLTQKAHDYEAQMKKKAKPKLVDDDDDQMKRILKRENKSTMFRRQDASKQEYKKSSAKPERRTQSLQISKSMEHLRKNRRYMYDVAHQGVQTKTSFGGYFAGGLNLLKDSEGVQLATRWVPRSEGVTCLYMDESLTPVPVLNTRVRVRCRDVGTMTMPEPLFLPLDEVLAADSAGAEPAQVEIKRLDFSELFPSMSRENLQTAMQSEADQTDEVVTDSQTVVKQVTVMEAPSEDECPLKPTKLPTVECTDSTCEMIDPKDIPMDPLLLGKTRIAMLPPEQQLGAAVKFLCDKGDPLAVLPKVESTPWLIRWFEKRRGVRTSLTQRDKDELMEKSIHLWDSDYTKVSAISMQPLKLSSKITFDKKEWLMKKAKAHAERFHRRLRQQMVNNARDFYPSFYTEYFNTPLNRSMRKTFFTYLPSRELDTYVFRPYANESKDLVVQQDDDE